MSKGKRSITDSFLRLLENDSSIQNVLLKIIQQDIDYCFEPRSNHVSVYYRGKVMIELKPHRDSSIECTFKGSARGDKDVSFLSSELTKELITKYRKEIDSYLAATKEWPEARFQFRIAHANSVNVSSNDCFLSVDSEYYQRKKDGWRLDIVAINKEKGALSLIEVKYGNDSLRTKRPDMHGRNGNPGILKHLEDFMVVRRSQPILQTMKTDFERVLIQKNKLNLIGEMPDYLDYGLNEVIFLFVICNYDFSDNRNLKEELDEIKADKELFQVCKNNTFFYFANYEEQCMRAQEYKLISDSFLDFETVMKRYSSKR